MMKNLRSIMCAAMALFALVIVSCSLNSKNNKKSIESNTPEEFRIKNQLDKETYEKHKAGLLSEIDSLLALHVIEEPAEYAHRFFEGEDYQDTIKRTTAIDLPFDINFLETDIDTLFYLEGSEHPYAAIFIGKYEALDGIRFWGQTFTYQNSKDHPFYFFGKTVSSFSNSTTARILKEYCLKERGEENKYNIDDVRFYEYEKNRNKSHYK